MSLFVNKLESVGYINIVKSSLSYSYVSPISVSCIIVLIFSIISSFVRFCPGKLNFFIVSFALGKVIDEIYDISPTRELVEI